MKQSEFRGSEQQRKKKKKGKPSNLLYHQCNVGDDISKQQQQADLRKIYEFIKKDIFIII
jgi:hypothetical protein